uniref:Uncharacterized protein n=1 Tax=Opuntia streptacantha TaxID=393608 RepID=A0A7C9AP98_OPUST
MLTDFFAFSFSAASFFLSLSDPNLMKTDSSSFLFESCCMDSNSLSTSTFRSSDFSDNRAFRFSSSSFSYSSRVISFSSGSFSSAPSGWASWLPSTASSPAGTFSAFNFFSFASPVSSARGATSSDSVPQFPRPEPSRLISFPRPVPLRRSCVLRGRSPSLPSSLLKPPRRPPR